MVGLVWSPLWAFGEGINQQLAGAVCQFTSLLALFHVVCTFLGVLVCTFCAACAAYTSHARSCMMSIMQCMDGTAVPLGLMFELGTNDTDAECRL